MTLAERARYAPATLLAVGLAATGVVTGNPVVLFAATIPLSLVAYGALVVAPPEDAVSVERTVTPESPRAGERLAVSVTVTNDSESYLPDVRVVDGVPDQLAVLDGSPRAHCTLAPGESATVEYAVRAARGEYTFDPAGVTVRSLAGTAERRTAAGPQTELRVPVGADPLPLDDRTATVGGRIETDDAGTGIAFHSSREYRPGDPINRVDWNRYASTGELSTVEFHEEQAATVVLVVDDRVSVRGVARPGELDAGERARRAAAELATALLDAGDRVGVAVKDAGGGFTPPRSEDSLEVSPTAYRHEEEGYLPPRGAGAAQETAVREYLDRRGEGRDDLPLRVDDFWFAGDLADYLPEDAQLVFCSPLADDDAVAAVETWLARGYPVTVLAPDPTGTGVGGRFAAVERDERLDDLRRSDATVVEWDGRDTLDAAVARAEVSR